MELSRLILLLCPYIGIIAGGSTKKVNDDNDLNKKYNKGTQILYTSHAYKLQSAFGQRQ